ncbi:MAG: hypothetical protein IK015_03850 [Treponema sp.]|nr:hypothetical protein [Treponema sp.]
MEFLFLLVGIAILVIALSYFAFGRRTKKAAPKQSAKPALVNCPMCGSGLADGQKMFSKVFRPMNVPDQRCVITGCPHCYPVCEPGVKRLCPVCGKTVPSNGHLVARLFNKTQGKKHVMIVGCSSCLKNEQI